MGKFTLFAFVRHQWTQLPEVSTFKADLTGKTVIVTGANVGLGLEAARHFARMNPGKLILACRDLKKGLAAVESIVQDTSCPTVECWTLDVGSFESVKAFASRFEREGGGRLDLLVENAGMGTRTYGATSDGWERSLQVNHLSTALLAFRMLPFLLAAPVSPPTPRLVIVASGIHFEVSDMSEVDAPNMLKKLSDAEHCAQPGVMHQRYAVSKLFNVLFTPALASRLGASPLTVNCVEPGFCHSELTREISSIFLYLMKLILARTTEVGSRTLVHAAVAPEIQGRTGQFFSSCHEMEVSDFALSEKGKIAQEKLWAETMEVLTQVDPEVSKIIREHLA